MLRCVTAAAVCVGLVVAGCGGTSGEPPPTGLTYSTSAATFLVGNAIAPITPTLAGGVASAWAVDPALPAGLALDPYTGVISGTPTAGVAEGAYTITAANSSGSTTATITLTVIAPPARVSYSTNPAQYLVGEPIEPNVPTVTGGTPTHFVAVPPLPNGFSLDPVTGIVTGTPTGLTPQTTFRITASNAAGVASVNLRITVTAAVMSCPVAENDTCLEWNDGFGGDVVTACSQAGGRIQFVACSTVDRIGRCIYAYRLPGPYTVTVSYYPGGGGTAAELEAACNAASGSGGALTTWVAG